MATNIDKALYQQPQGMEELGRKMKRPLRLRLLIPKLSTSAPVT
jgi:hypothetical protein